MKYFILPHFHCFVLRRFLEETIVNALILNLSLYLNNFKYLFWAGHYY